MFFCGFDASSWIDHPFWKSKFLIKESAHVQLARSSGIVYCWIDIDKGDDVAPPPEAEAEDADREELVDAFPSPAMEETVAPDFDQFADDIGQAQLLCESAKTATTIMFNEIRLGKAVNMEHCLPLVDQITASVMQNSSALISVVRLKISDDYTYMHSVAVCALMIALGRTLGMDEVACKEAGLAGLLHDIGKSFIPLGLLNKPSALTPMEYEIVQRHTSLGYTYLTKDAAIPSYASEVVLHHHEKIDGTGYPDQLSGSGISMLSRMTAICDVYDAVTSDRPYKKGWDPADALAKMANWRGHFDRAMFSAFVKTLGIYPIGSLVKMQSGRMGLVVRQNADVLTKPVVKTFLPDENGEIIDTQMLDLAAPDVTDSILQRGGEDWLKFNNLDQLWLQARQG